ncbi:fibronectin type III domain-containing protein [Bifidobacterium rousetti]|uniref:fibronectin type III domain-containing protein n=1 Tax=Bifidobacterium rousetti TaxID=2045439 RepID=UPI00168A7A8F|nr:fibronectin type III domain-containing protein [Bifidobacterium rousetti]
MRLNLNGVWDFYPNGGDERHDIVVPTWWDSLSRTTGYPEDWEKGLRHGVYVKTVELPADITDEDVFLHVGALATLGKVFVNGRSVGPVTTKGYLMTLLPYDLDINDAVRPGEENEIRIEVWSVKALPDDALATEGGPDRLLFPFGVENIVGRVGIGEDVAIVTRPKLRIDDLQIMPDLKKNADPSDDELAVNVTVVNHTASDADLELDAVVRPFEKSDSGDSGNAGDDVAAKPAPALAFDAEHVHVAAGETAVVRLTKGWPTAHYWSRTDPFLYTLDATISVVSANGGNETVHEASDRFGFRQFWREGDKYIFNGIKIRLRGDSLCLLNQGDRDLINEIGDAYGVILDDNHATDEMAKAWLDAYQHANCNIIRNHIRSVPSHVLMDHADETGMLLEEETAFWNPGSTSNVSLEPPYYLNYSDEAIGYYVEWVERWVREYRNHPSIILWSTTNEAWNPNDAEILIPPLEAAANREDPTRMVINDGFNKPITNEDSRHYFGGYPSGMTSAPDIYDLYQIDGDLPLGAGEEFSVSTAGIPQYAEDGTIKDIYHGRLNGNPDTISRADFGREVGRVTRGVRTTRMANWKPFCLSMFIYDNIEKVIELDQSANTHGLNPKALLRPQFDPTATGDARWIEGDGYRYFANSYSDVAAFDKEFDKEPRLGLPHSIYALGTTSQRTLIVYNDEEIDGTELEVRWTVSALNTATGERREVESGSKTVTVGHGEFVETPITIHVPGEVETYESKLIETLSVVKAGKVKFTEDNFLGWIGRPAPAKIGSNRPGIDLGRVDWASRNVKHCLHLNQQGGALSEKWTARVVDDAAGSISFERLSGNLRHEQELFYTVNVAGLEQGREYTGQIEYTGENDDTVTITVRFVAGAMPAADEAANKALGATVRVSSSSTRNGWTAASLVDGEFKADYNHFGWSSEPSKENRDEWALLKLAHPTTVAQVVLAPRGENPGGTVAEAFHGEGEGVGGVQEFAAGHRAFDPNQGQGFPVDFTISVSADGRAWTKVADKRDYALPDNGKPRAFDFAPVENVQYVKVEATKLRSNPNEHGEYALQLVEIAVFDDHRMPAIPSEPTDVAVAVQAHDVQVSWQFASDGRSPILGTTLTLTNTDGEVIPAAVTGTDTHALIADVPAGEWTVTVQGRNEIGEGESAVSAPFKVGRAGAGEVDATLPRPKAPVAELLVESGSVAVSFDEVDTRSGFGRGGANIHLTPVSDASGSADALPKRTAWVPVGTTAFTFADVARGTYTVTVEATNGEDRVSDPSDPSDPVIVAAVPAKPNKPGVTSAGDTMNVTWKAPVDGGAAIDSYVLTLRNLTENTVKVVKAAAGEESKSVSGLTPGNYTASVIAVNAIGMSAESSPSLPCLIK